MRNYLVKHVMLAKRVQSILESDTLANAFLILDELAIGAMPVHNEEGQFIGVLSKTDLVRKRLLTAWQAGSPPDQLFVKDFMNRTPPKVVKETDHLSDAVGYLHKFGIHRVFVMDDHGQISGVLSTTDVIKALHVDRLHWTD